MSKLRVLDLFSGIGGFSLGLERTGGFETVAFCEIEEYPRKVLAKHWPKVPIYDDVRGLSAARLDADGIAVDVIAGGFPCQDISVDGDGEGLDGERSGLWYEYARLVGEIRPRFVIVENVSELLARGLGEVLGSLAAIGYDAEWNCIRASRVGLPHHRDRVWLVAYPYGQRLQGRLQDRTIVRAETLPLAEIRDEVPTRFISHGYDGLPRRVVRSQGAIKALGNAVVPQIPFLIGQAILRVHLEGEAA
jgi:DNA (cytosine-5)-methyltransferase 1